LSRVPLAFRSLGVRRMPGIADGGWELPDLSPGVNVVWGPNGSGKTTTAGALERLLWPAASRDGRPALDARLTLGGEEWRAELDGGAARFQRDGQDAAAPGGLPPATERDRYRISLHELLNGTDGSLAERILHESAGGFDVARAADGLGFRKGAGTAQKQRDALKGARARMDEVRAEEGRLRGDEAELHVLRRQAAEHEASAKRRELLARALERMDAARVEHAAREALDAFPPALAGLQGDEAERLRTLRQVLEGARARARAAEQEAAAARRTLDGTALPAEGLPDDVLSRLSAAMERLRQLEDTRLRLQRELECAREECRAERTAVAGAVGDDHVAALTLPAVEELLRFAREAEQHRAAMRAVEAELELLAGDGPPADADALRRGRDALSAWLRQPDAAGGNGRARGVAVAAAALAALAGAALGGLVHPAGWALVLVALVLLGLALAARGERGRRAELQGEYGRLKLRQPARWEPDPVAELIVRLEAEIAEARHLAHRAERRAAAEGRRAALETRAGEIGRAREELALRVGLAPDADEAAVAWLCQRVHRWQGAQVAVGRAEAELRTAAQQHAHASAELGGWIAPFAAAEVGSAAEVAGTLDALRARQQAHGEAHLTLRAAQTRHREALEEAERCAAERAMLLARAGLAEDEDRRMDELCGMLPAFVAARERCLGAQQDARTAERRLAETPEYDDAVAAQPRQVVEAALAESRAAAERAEAARQEVTRLEERQRAARERTDVEEALARLRDAEAALRDQRERDEAAAAGWVLREYVERETRDRDRPAVFHRARALFAAVTRGRYRLELSEATPPEFRAVDTASGTGCALDELSRGTRVQLLLSVRIAFIETLEAGVQLPLVLDEALANSDDLRAEAVMDAVIELARGGRQVFLLTARMDEAERWMARLGPAGLEHRLVDLAEARRLARFVDLPRPAAGTLRMGVVPPPGEMDHAAYGAALRVPPIDLDHGGPDGVHLWYLVDDPALLHRLLSLGTETWGGLRAMVDAVGTALLGPDGSGFARLEALGRAMDRLLESRRVGRGRRVDREALERSGAISATFMDRVDVLRQGCGGRPDRLLEGVDDLRGFRSDKRTQLREFLEREGYLDAREPLGEVVVRGELLAALGPDLRAGHCTAADVERLLALVPAGS
jgi:energy-coupling factor transporter ATP-binding protein EcfA2